MILHELAERLALSVEGDGETPLSRLASLDTAGPGDLTFVVSSKYKAALRATKASAVIVPADLAGDAPCPYLIAESPYLAYADASWILHPEAPVSVGVAETAFVDPTASVHALATVGEFAVIGAGCEVAANAVIGAHCTLGANSRIGEQTRLMPRVSVANDCTIGAHGRVQSGAVIGSEGFGFAPDKGGWKPIHQVGHVVIGQRVPIGANPTIDRHD